MTNQMWQLCIKCNGTGQIHGNFGYGTCDVCSGSKLISLLTGKPPFIVKSTTSSTIKTIINQPNNK